MARTHVKPKPLKELFEQHIMPITECGCWFWMASIIKSRKPHYGAFQRDVAHRKAWEIYNGEIPRGFLVLHKCDIPICVNPNHLFLGNQQDNMKDCSQKNRYPKGNQKPNAKLTEDDVIAIRNDHRSSNEIAKTYKLNPRTISRIKCKERWKHI